MSEKKTIQIKFILICLAFGAIVLDLFVRVRFLAIFGVFTIFTITIMNFFPSKTSPSTLQQPVQRTQQVSGPPLSRAKFCNACGSENKPDGKFCVNCGNQLSSSPTSYQIPATTSTFPTYSQDNLLAYFFLLIIIDIIFSFFITLAIFQLVNSISPQPGGFASYMSYIFGLIFLFSFIFGSLFIEPLTDKLHNK